MNVKSDDYFRPFIGGVSTGWNEGMRTDQRMSGSKQDPQRGSSMSSKGLSQPAFKGTYPRTRPGQG